MVFVRGPRGYEILPYNVYEYEHFGRLAVVFEVET